MSLPDLTREVPAPGLVVRQPRRGYRYGVEVYLLADFALRGGGGRVVELGCGSGVVSLLLAAAGADVLAVERDARWVAVARSNVAESVVGGRVTVVEGDARTWTGDADVVVTNPPWFDPTEGPVSPDDWRAASRTALHGTPEDFVATGLRAAPRVCVVGPREVILPRGARWLRRVRYGRLWLGEAGRGDGSGAATPAIEDWGDAERDAAYRRWRG